MNFPTKLKIAVVGTGAIGAYYGSLLAQAGHEVHFLLRSDYEAVKANGYHVQTPKAKFHLHPVNAHNNTADIGPCDLVVIALKTTANAIFPEILPPLNSPGKTVFLTLQNGMGNVEKLGELFGLENVVAGLCFVCVNRTAPGVIENYMPGYIQIAEASGTARERTQALAKILQDSGTECKVSDSLERALWCKLCWNVPFNGIAIAAGGITTDKIMQSPPLRILAEKLMRELQAAAAAYGVSISEKFIEGQFTVTDGMGPYKPSSLIDYWEKRPVEVESIWGEPLRRGLAKGIPMGNLDCLYHLLDHLVRAKA
ncbi:MAG: 2-dehydropantoate 2-reductase [Puniceicoccales bacterium]|jgi:2-dehydropantoate 2-reductase|nr:2-dehydropantoate 2-reductase [Puniceicoccales bacterium]